MFKTCKQQHRPVRPSLQLFPLKINVWILRIPQTWFDDDRFHGLKYISTFNLCLWRYWTELVKFLSNWGESGQAWCALWWRKFGFRIWTAIKMHSSCTINQQDYSRCNSWKLRTTLLATSRFNHKRPMYTRINEAHYWYCLNHYMDRNWQTLIDCFFF